MALTPQQIIELRNKAGLTNGKSVDDIISQAEVKLAPKQSRFQETVQDVKQTGTNIFGSLSDAGKKIKDVGEAKKAGEQGEIRSRWQRFGATAGGVSNVIGDLFTGAGKVVLSQDQENAVKNTLVSAMTPIVQSGAVQSAMARYEQLKTENPALARDLEALVGAGSLALDLSGLGAGKKVVTTGVDVAVTGAKEAALATGDALTTAAKSASEIAKPVIDGAVNVGGGIAETASRIPGRVATNVADRQAAREVVQALPTRVSRQAVQDGVDIADVNTLLRIPETEKSAVKNLLKSVQEFALGKTSVRPEEIVGKPMVQAIKTAESQAAKIGQKLGETAKNLGVVTQEDLFVPVFTKLKKAVQGLKLKADGTLDFSGTVLTTAETAADRKAIQSVFNDAVKWGNGLKKHKLRQELFEILGGKKKSLANITATQEKAYQAIREGLSDVLDSKNPAYKLLNSQYRKVKEPLDELNKFLKGVSGADEDIRNMSAGLLARRLTSNAPSNPQVRAILRSLDDALKNSGQTFTSIENLQDVYNILDRYYDIAAKTGFKGQIEGAIKPSGGFIDRALGAVSELTGQTPAVRQKALEKLLQDILK